MLLFFFVYDTSANSIVLAKPKKSIDRYKSTVNALRHNKEAGRLSRFEKLTTKSDDCDLLIQKMPETYLFGAFVHNSKIRTNRAIFESFGKIFWQLPDPKAMKTDQRFRSIVKNELAPFRQISENSASKIKDLTKTGELEIQKDIDRQLKIAGKLKGTNHKITMAHELAEENDRETSILLADAKRNDFIARMFLYGCLGLLLIWVAFYLISLSTSKAK